MRAIDVETKPAFHFGRSRTLFNGRHKHEHGFTLDVAPDGKRFLMIKPDPDESGSAHLKVVLNGFEDVKRGVPRAK